MQYSEGAEINSQLTYSLTESLTRTPIELSGQLKRVAMLLSISNTNIQEEKPRQKQLIMNHAKKSYVDFF